MINANQAALAILIQRHANLKPIVFHLTMPVILTRAQAMYMKIRHLYQLEFPNASQTNNTIQEENSQNFVLLTEQRRAYYRTNVKQNIEPLNLNKDGHDKLGGAIYDEISQHGRIMLQDLVTTQHRIHQLMFQSLFPRRRNGEEQYDCDEDEEIVEESKGFEINVNGFLTQWFVDAMICVTEELAYEPEQPMSRESLTNAIYKRGEHAFLNEEFATEYKYINSFVKGKRVPISLLIQQAIQKQAQAESQRMISLIKNTREELTSKVDESIQALEVFKNNLLNDITRLNTNNSSHNQQSSSVEQEEMLQNILSQGPELSQAVINSITSKTDVILQNIRSQIPEISQSIIQSVSEKTQDVENTMQEQLTTLSSSLESMSSLVGELRTKIDQLVQQNQQQRNIIPQSLRASAAISSSSSSLMPRAPVAQIGKEIDPIMSTVQPSRVSLQRIGNDDQTVNASFLK